MEFVEMLKFVSPIAILFGGLLWVMRSEANRISREMERRLDEKLREIEVKWVTHTHTQVRELREWVRDPKDGPLALVHWRLEKVDTAVDGLDDIVATKEDVARAVRSSERFTMDAIRHVVVQLPNGKDIHVQEPGKSG